MDAELEKARALLAKMRGWEIALRLAEGNADERAALSDAVGVRALRLEELAGERGLLPVPEAEPQSQIAQDDDRDWARMHGDLTVDHQAGSRLFAAFDHLVAHSEGWRVQGDIPPFHVYPEFTVLRGALEATVAAWWLLAPEASQDRVQRALASKKQEAHYEAQAVELRAGSPTSANSFRQEIKHILAEASREVGSEAVKFPRFSELADEFGGPDYGPAVGVCWRECSSYAHGFDWAAWHHRGGMAESTAPYRVLAEAFVVSCDALHTVWTELWLTLALKDPPVSLPPVFLPQWPTLETSEEE